MCRASQRESLKRGISYCAILIPSIEKGATYELGNRPLDDNLTLGDNLTSDIPTLSVLLVRVSLVWAGLGWGAALSYHMNMMNIIDAYVGP